MVYGSDERVPVDFRGTGGRVADGGRGAPSLKFLPARGPRHRRAANTRAAMLVNAPSTMNISVLVCAASA